MTIDELPDLILRDNWLPDAIASNVPRQLASSQTSWAIPVVMVTRNAGGATVDRLLATGAAGLIAEPFDIHQFISVLARHLD